MKSNGEKSTVSGMPIFENNRKIVNSESDETTGRKIIYYFTKYNNRPVENKEIAETLKVPPPQKNVEEKIEKLYLADLVYRSAARFCTFNDICLMRFIKFVYARSKMGMAQVEKLEQSRAGSEAGSPGCRTGRSGNPDVAGVPPAVSTGKSSIM